MSVGSTSTIAVAPGRLVIHTVGLRELSKTMRFIDIDVARYSATGVVSGPISKVFAAEMRQAALPLAGRARAKAAAFSKTGAFAGSITTGGGRTGVYLKSSDPGAGPIEFAHPGAVAVRGDNAGKPIGVPSGEPARALFPAIDESLPEMEIEVAAVVERALQDYLDRDFAVVD